MRLVIFAFIVLIVIYGVLHQESCDTDPQEQTHLHWRTWCMRPGP